MKRLKFLFTVLCMLCGAVAFAHDFEVDGIYYKITDATNKTVAVTYSGSSYNSVSNEYSGSVIIPQTISYNAEVYSVTSIDERAFYYCSGLTSVVIGNSVTSIGNQAFYYCSGLTSIEIPNSVTSIGSSAFYGCSGLTSIVIPSSVTSIGDYAFYNCPKLKTVVNFSSLTFSKGYSYNGHVAYYADRVINAPNGVLVGDFVFFTADGKHTLAGYSGNETEITLPDNYNGENYVIGADAFKGVKTITSIVIPNSVTSIGNSAFSGCSGLTSVTIGNSVTSIENYAFNGCSGLTSITIPSSVTSIGNYAFDGCTSLKDLRIENSEVALSLGISSNYNGLFYYCPLETVYLGRSLSYSYVPFRYIKTLTSVILGNSVANISGYLFEGCSALESIVVEPGNPRYDSRENCNAVIETESNTLVSGCKNTIIPNSITSIGNYAFEDCSGLTGIEIPNSVTRIGDYAFQDCSGLTSVTIGNSVTSIGGSAFKGCSALTGITIPKSVTGLGWSSFESCSALESIVVEPGNPRYDSRENCNAVVETESNTLVIGCKNTIIPNNVTSIGYYAFNGCSGLTSVTIPNSVTSIGYCAFDGCSGLTSIEIPNSVTSIGDYAFDGCINLTEVTSNAVVAPVLGSNAFDSDCSMVLNYPQGSNYIRWAEYFDNFTKYVYGTYYGDATWYIDNEGNAIVSGYIETVPHYRGDYINNIKSITIEGSFTQFEYSFIANCNFNRETLEEIYLPESLTTINSDAFSDCYNLKKVVMSNSLTTIEDNAFRCCYNLQNIILPNTLTTIGAYAFYECKKLHNLYLPNSLTTIGDNAFYESGIEAMLIPSSVTSIGDYIIGSYWVDDKQIDPILVFRSVDAPDMGELYCNVCIPEAANGYPSSLWIYDRFNSEGEYCIYGNNCEKMFVFGNVNIYDYDCDYDIRNYKDNIESVIFQPTVTDWSFMSRLPNIKYIDVAPCTPKQGRIYTLEGSNAIYRYDGDFENDKILVAGCATSTIPEGTTQIGYNAFSGCSGLTNIVIPNSVTSIGGYAFSGCSGLTSIEIPNSITYIEDGAFSGCSGLTGIEIPNSVTYIGYGTFSNCSGLENVIIGNGVEYLNSSFAGCNSLKSIKIGTNVRSVSASDFGSAVLESIVVDEGNTHIDSRENCNAVIETSTNKLLFACKNSVIPATVTTIGGGAYSNVHYADFTVPVNITAIEKNAFSGFNDVYFESETPATINGNVFGRGVIFVPASAYETYCNASVWSDYKDRIVTTEIAYKAIEATAKEGGSGVLDAIGIDEVGKVVSLKVTGSINSYDIIIFRDKMPLLRELDLSDATVIASNKTYYANTYTTGNNTLGGYAFYDLDKLVNVKLPKNLNELGDYTFFGCANLANVDASATNNLNIGTFAFKDCAKLEDIIFPDSVSAIEANAFESCGALDTLNINNVAESIDTKAFLKCGNLVSVNIASIGGDIMSYVFMDCGKLEEVKVGALCGNLTGYAFANCGNLKYVEFGKGPLSIGNNVFTKSSQIETFIAGEGVVEVRDNAFLSCSNLKKVSLPESVVKIGAYAFKGCRSLSDFAIPKNVASIGTESFNECRSLENVVIPDGVTVIPKSAFYYCSALKTVTFPNELVSIDASAFRYCSALEQVKLPPTVKVMSDMAFADCRALTEIHIPSSLEVIGNSAFAGCNILNSVYTYTIEPTVITESTFSTFATATLYVPATSFSYYYFDNGWSKFNHNNFKEFNKPYDYFYLNNDYILDENTGYIEGTPDADLRPGSGLVVEGETDGEDPKQNLGDVNVEHNGDSISGSIIADNNLHIDNLFIRINVKGGRWYFFAFPFDIKLDKISMQNGSDYVFRHYDGEERAKKGKGGWKDVKESHLKAARGYIFQCSADDVLVLSIEDVKFKKEDKYNELVTHVSENLNDASWNLMGNPYLSYYDMADMNYTAPVTVWDGTKYVAIRPGDDDYQFTPYEAFFVQKPEGQENIAFDGEQQMTKNQANTKKQHKIAARRTRGIDLQRLLVNLVLSDGEANDRARVVFNNRQTHNYETACDAAKFETAGLPQIYTIDDEGVRYAINERPVGNGVVFIGYAAPAVGYYTIEAPRMDTKVFLYDAETGEKHYFEDGAYSFYSAKGTFEKRFSLGVRDDATTGVEGIEEDEANGENGNAESVYDLHGRKLKRADKGIFIINGEKVVK